MRLLAGLERHSRSLRVDAAIILVGSALLYLPVMGQFFLSDDFLFMRMAGRALSEGIAPLLLLPSPFNYYRPVEHVSFALDFALGGTNPTVYHLTNIVLHTGCLFLLSLLYAWWAPEDPWTRRAGLLLFLVHPFHSNSVAWISGRSDLLCSLFVLGTLAIHLGDPSRWPLPRRIAALTTYALALGSKEAALVVPALIFLLELAGGGKRAIRSRTIVAAGRAAPYALMATAFLLVCRVRFGSFGRFGDKLSMPAAAGNYLLSIILGFIPIPIDAQRSVLLLHGGTVMRSPFVLVACGLLVCVAPVLAWRLRKDRPFVISSVFFLVAALPMAGGIGSWRYYLPSAGLALCLARLIWHSARLVGRWLSSRTAPGLLPAFRDKGPQRIASALLVIVAAAWCWCSIVRRQDIAYAAARSKVIIDGLTRAVLETPDRPILVFNLPFMIGDAPPIWSNSRNAIRVMSGIDADVETANLLNFNDTSARASWKITRPGVVWVRADPRRGVHHFSPTTAVRGGEAQSFGNVSVQVIERDPVGRPVEALFTVDDTFLGRRPRVFVWSPGGLADISSSIHSDPDNPPINRP